MTGPSTLGIILKKGIYISGRLLKVLNRKELKAVYYHEKGHGKNALIDYLSKAVAGIWLSLFSAVFSVVIFLFFFPVVFFQQKY
jgi:Zn-dependent protease with chaperone function